MTELGTVLFFNRDKGYGFILRDGLQQNDINSQIFVHASAIGDPIEYLQPKQRVSFEIIAAKKPGSLEAMNVRVISDRS
jgi:cold shock CspA family protein